MNVLKKSILLGGCVAVLTFGAGNHLMAQGRNFDPAQMKQDMLDRTREQLEIKDDKEWGAIEPLVGKVMDANRDVMGMRMGGMFGRGGAGGRRGNRGGGGGESTGTSSSTNSAASDQPRQRRNNPFGEPSPAVTALREAIEAKAPAAEIKTKLAAVRAERKDKEAKLEAAEEELRGVLSSRQEAIAVSNGLLK